MIIWIADNMIFMSLIFFIFVGLAIFAIAYTIAKKRIVEFSMKFFAAVAVGAFIIGFLPVAAFGIFRGWVFSSGYNEVNHAAIKAQEKIYPLTDMKTVSIIGSEPDASTRKKARALKNPVAPTSKSIALGRDLFKNYCKPCHGKDGGGQGTMGSVPMLKLTPDSNDPESLQTYLGNFMGTKPNFDIQIVQHRTEGDIYYTVTNGGEAIMPSFRDAMSPEQRWSLINFIKNELGKNDN